MIYNEVLSYQQDQQAKLKSVATTSSTTALSQNAQVDSNGNSKSKFYCCIRLSCKKLSQNVASYVNHVDTGRKLNVHKTSRTSSERLLYVHFTSFVYREANLSELINFYSSWNHQKSYAFLMISEWKEII